MPSIATEGSASCRVRGEDACAWIDRGPVEHRNPGPGAQRVEILERTEGVCVYRVQTDRGWETTRRVRVAPNRWTGEQTSEGRGVGRFRVKSVLTVSSEGEGCRLTQVVEATPLNAHGALSAWMARAGRRRLAESASRHVAAMALEIEADHGLAVEPRAALRKEVAPPGGWTRWGELHSQYAPDHDWAGGGVFLAGVVGGALGAFLLGEEGIRLDSTDPVATAALFVTAFLLVVVVAVSLAYLFDRWRTVEGIDPRPNGISVRPRLGAVIEIPWTDVGVEGMRLRGDRYLVHFRHPRFGPDNLLWLTREHARAVLSSNYCHAEKPSSVVLSALGLGQSSTMPSTTSD